MVQRLGAGGWLTGARRWVFATIVLGVPLLWAVVPYGQRMGDLQDRTFAAALLETADEVLANQHRWGSEEVLLLPPICLGLLAPLYPALQAAALLLTPRRFARRRRFVWIVEGIALVLLAACGMFWAYFALVVIMFGASGSPVVYPPLFVLPGFAALAGLASIAIGIAPRGGIARLILETRANRE